MKKILLVTVATAMMVSGAAQASGNNNGIGGYIMGTLGGSVDVSNIGIAIGDRTATDSVSVKVLEGAEWFDTDTGEAGMSLRLYGATEGKAVSRSRGHGASLSATGESGTLFITGGGSFMIGGGSFN